MCPELGKLQLDTSPSIQRGAGNSPSTEARMRDTISATVTAFGCAEPAEAADPPDDAYPGSVASRMHYPFEPLGNLLNRGRLPRRRIYLDQQAVQLHVAISHIGSDGDARQEAS